MCFKKLSFILLLLMAFLAVSAQDKQAPPYQNDLDRADLAFKFKKYNTAAALYQKVYPKIKEVELKQKVLFLVAESYRKSNNFKQAIKWFEDVLNSRYPDPSVLYSYGQLLKNFERYDEANRTFYDYSFEVPDDPKGKQAQISCQYAADWKAHPAKFQVDNVKDVNTEFSEYAPFYCNKKLVFTSSRKEAQGTAIFEWTGQKYSDLFEATHEVGTFTKITPIKSLNTNFNEGVAWLDSAGNTIFFTQCNGVDGKGLNCKIYSSFKQNEVWTKPVPLPFNSDSFSCGHPFFSPDGKRLFLSSDKPGGSGEKDIWMIAYDPIRNTWGEMVNLGKQVNTPEDELFPSVNDKGQIFFSSKGMYGMGGLDLFETEDSAGTFKVPVNLQYPINSGGDDFGIHFLSPSDRKEQNKLAYYTSNREGGLGDDDIYSIAIKPFVFLVRGKVLERESQQPIGSAQVKLSTSDGKQLFNIKTNDKGAFASEIPLQQLMELQATKEKYLSSGFIQLDSRGPNKDSVIELTILLDPIPSADVEFTLQGIYYDLDKWDLRPEAKVVLDSLILILKSNPGLVIELASHTDSRAPADYNLELSKKRAQSCVDYLIQKGINKERLVPIGYGETRLVNDCSDDVDCTEAEHQQNRRTTFKVLRTDFKNKGR